MFQKLNLNLIVSYVGVLVCVGLLAKDQSYHALVGLFLFLANINLRKFFKHIERKEIVGLDEKIKDLTKRVREIDHELQKLIVTQNVKGILR